MSPIEQIENKCFEDPECQPDCMAFVIKQAIQVNNPDVEKEVESEGLIAVGHDLINRVTARAITIIEYAKLNPDFTVEDINNYFNICDRMKHVRMCAERFADFIADYNNWKYNY